MSNDKDLMKDLDALLAEVQGKPAPKQEVRIRRQPRPPEAAQPEESEGVETKESEGGFTPPDPKLLDPNSRTHWRNKGRESLFDLEPNKVYFVEGLMSGVYETNRETNIRIAVKDVIVKPYRVDMRYDEIPVVAFASHINSIRKRQGMEYLNLSEGQKHIFPAKLESYVSFKDPEIERRSFKLMRGIDVGQDVREIEKRVRSVLTSLESLDSDEIVVRLNKTISMCNRLWNVSQEYFFIPFYSKQELEERTEGASKACRSLLKLYG